MRAFIAFEIPKDVRDYLFEVANSFNDVVSAKWVAKKHLHLTLRFFREISSKDSEFIISKLQKFEFKPIKVTLEKLGVFPLRDIPRVLWVDVKQTGQIISLKEDVDDILTDKFDKEKDFTVHLTLGRIKKIKNKDEFLKKLNNFKLKPLEFELNNLKLIESKLTREGPLYMVLENKGALLNNHQNI